MSIAPNGLPSPHTINPSLANQLPAGDSAAVGSSLISPTTVRVQSDDDVSLHEFLQDYDKYESNLCSEVTGKYEKIMKIGQGTFGEVFKARHKKFKQLIALKKIRMEQEREGFPITALREIKILQVAKHNNLVNLLEICKTAPNRSNRHRSDYYLVFEMLDHDLAGLLANQKFQINLAEKKDMVRQLLEGIYYLHGVKILHRDMKAANILLSRKGVLKIADFGLARPYTKSTDRANRYTGRVVTLWYRPPELLLGDRDYGPPLDMWGVGCIIAEMWTRTPIMQGDLEQKQLTLITNLCGSITPDVWPGVEKLELYEKMCSNQQRNLKRKVKERLKVHIESEEGLDMIDKLLCLNPAQRMTAEQALEADFFFMKPDPISIATKLSQLSESCFELLVSNRQTANAAGGVLANPHNAPSSSSSSNFRKFPAPENTAVFDRIF